METNIRIVARVISWRIGGIILTIALTWLFARNIVLGAQVGVTYNVVRVLTHFAHEYVWEKKIKWGRK
jgi:uncharacterized membrane protein